MKFGIGFYENRDTEVRRLRVLGWERKKFITLYWYPDAKTSWDLNKRHKSFVILRSPLGTLYLGSGPSAA